MNAPFTLKYAPTVRVHKNGLPWTEEERNDPVLFLSILLGEYGMRLPHYSVRGDAIIMRFDSPVDATHQYEQEMAPLRFTMAINEVIDAWDGRMPAALANAELWQDGREVRASKHYKYKSLSELLMPIDTVRGLMQMKEQTPRGFHALYEKGMCYAFEGNSPG